MKEALENLSLAQPFDQLDLDVHENLPLHYVAKRFDSDPPSTSSLAAGFPRIVKRCYIPHSLSITHMLEVDIL